MTKKYKALIIGAGNQGALADALGSGNEHKIISFAHAFKEYPGFELIGFIDLDLIKSTKASEIWGTSHPLRMNLDKLDIIAITTPDASHYEDLKIALKHNPKLVICEKPLCTDLQQAREIVEIYKAKGIPLMVNYTRRFLPYYEDLKRRYDAGEFGRLFSAVAQFNRGILHTGTHAVDFFEWFFNKQLYKSNEIHCNILEVEAPHRIWWLNLFFEKFHWQEQRIGDMPVWDYYDKSHWHVVDNAYNVLEGREPLKCTGEDGLRALEICYELMEAKTK